MRIKNCSYDMKGNVKFDIDETHYEFGIKELAGEMLYLIYDSIGMNLNECDKVMDIIDKLEEGGFKHIPIYDENNNFIGFEKD